MQSSVHFKGSICVQCTSCMLAAYSYRLASGTWVNLRSRPKLGHMLQFQPALIASRKDIYMEQGQSWGTVQFQSGIASGILPELARVQHSSSQILHHTCEAQLQILYALVILKFSLHSYCMYVIYNDLIFI